MNPIKNNFFLQHLNKCVQKWPILSAIQNYFAYIFVSILKLDNQHSKTRKISSAPGVNFRSLYYKKQFQLQGKQLTKESSLIHPRKRASVSNFYLCDIHYFAYMMHTRATENHLKARTRY